jgi:hypothetical protein
MLISYRPSGGSRTEVDVVGFDFNGDPITIDGRTLRDYPKLGHLIAAFYDGNVPDWLTEALDRRSARDGWKVARRAPRAAITPSPAAALPA